MVIAGDSNKKDEGLERATEVLLDYIDDRQVDLQGHILSQNNPSNAIQCRVNDS